MKNFLILVVILSLANVLAAQKDDVIFMKDSSIYRGQIIENVPNSHIRLQTKCENIMYITSSEIIKIERMKPLIFEKFNKRNTIYNLTEIGLLFGKNTETNVNSFSISNVTGYYVTEKIGIGVGLGAEFFEYSYCPITSDFRYTVFKEKFTPVLFLQGGYQLPIENYYFEGEKTLKGGYFFNPGIALRNVISQNTALQFSVSYRFQKLFTKENYYPYYYEYYNYSFVKRTYTHSRINLRLGLFFK